MPVLGKGQVRILSIFSRFTGHSSRGNDIAEIGNAFTEESTLPRLAFQPSLQENLEISIQNSQEVLFCLGEHQQVVVIDKCVVAQMRFKEGVHEKLEISWCVT